MGMLLAFSPFLAFLAGERHFGIVPALCAGAVVAGGLVVRERLRGAREVRVLEAGTAVLFAVLTACAVCVTGIAWSVGLVRLVVDIGLMLLVVAGIAFDKPFTLAIAREKVTPDEVPSERMLKACKQIAVAWAGAFGVLAVADLVWMLRPQWPLAVPVAIGLAGLAGAALVTKRLSAGPKAGEGDSSGR